MTIILRFQCDILEKHRHLKGKKPRSDADVAVHLTEQLPPI